MTMKVREDDENAQVSICRNDESDSVEIDKKDPQQLKQEKRRISTIHAMTMDAREEWKNAEDSTESNKMHRVHLDENSPPIAPPSSSTNVALSIVTAAWSDSRGSVASRLDKSFAGELANPKVKYVLRFAKQ
jgi:hypothetical protein